ncbi:MAG: hypothetical protein EOM05_08105 [Clostridia bacterium]|nr:hypothetical protein [Clostridia bacterium]
MAKINNQMKVLSKVFDVGYVTEKDIVAMSIDKILAIPSITVEDITVISELQKAVKSNKVITFLGGSINDK